MVILSYNFGNNQIRVVSSIHFSTRPVTETIINIRHFKKVALIMNFLDDETNFKYQAKEDQWTQIDVEIAMIKFLK